MNEYLPDRSVPTSDTVSSGDEAPGHRAPCSRHHAAHTAPPNGTTNARGNKSQRDALSILNCKLTSSPRQAGGPLPPSWELKPRPRPPGEHRGQTEEEGRGGRRETPTGRHKAPRADCSLQEKLRERPPHRTGKAETGTAPPWTTATSYGPCQ